MNPPNVPEIRPIETFWAHCKNKLLKTRRHAKDARTFTQKWNDMLKSLKKDHVKRLMEGLNGKVIKFYRGSEI